METKYWRCVERIDEYTPGAVYEAVSGCACKVPHVLGSYVNDLSYQNGRFIPWVPQVGDWLGNDMGVFPAPDLIITSILEFIDPDSFEKFKCAVCGNDGRFIIPLEKAVPMLHRAPAYITPSHVIPITFEHRCGYCAGNHSSAEHRSVKYGEPVHYSHEDHLAMHTEAQRAFAKSPVGQAPLVTPPPPAPIPSYIGASDRHTAAMRERQEATARMKHCTSKVNSDTFGEQHRWSSQDQENRQRAIIARLQEGLAAKRPKVKPVHPKPVRTGVYDPFNGWNA